MRCTRVTLSIVAASLIALPLAIFTLRGPSSESDTAAIPHAPTPVAAPLDATSTPEPAPMPTQRSGSTRADEPPRDVRAPLPRDDLGASPTRLPSEARLLADGEGRAGMDARAVASLLKGHGFVDVMNALSRESSASPLALDITELYVRSADAANAGVDGAVAARVACGPNVCLLSASAPSKEVFDAWFEAFLTHPSAPPHAAGRHDKILEDGSVEYRLVFSNDPGRNAVRIGP